jgi:phytoene dehydrogenase-like protein
VAGKHEVVVIGGGHNGLTVACYLAKAGVDVCVVESLPYVGGGVITIEAPAPGFKTDICSQWHGFIQPNPLILHDEVGLISKFGLKYIKPPGPQNSVLFSDDSYITLYDDIDATCESIAKFSQRDAEAYKRFHDWAGTCLDMLLQGMYNPPAPFGTMVSMLDQSEEGRGLLRSLMVSAEDICDDWFESFEVKTMLTRVASENLISPRTKGTGFVLFVFIPLTHKYGGAIPEGGSGALSEAMERCIVHYGGTILTDSFVEKLITSNGEARGVVLKGGKEVLATKAVISNLNAKQIPELVDNNIPDDFRRNLKNLKLSSFRAINQGYALKEPPNFTAGDVVNNSYGVQFAPKAYEKYLRTFDDLEYGYTCSDILGSSCVTRLDPTRAPEGKHTLYLYHYAPYDLVDGGAIKWDQVREEVADEILARFQRQTTNMGSDNILARIIETPLDLERRNPAMIGGDFCHLGMYLNQLMGNRYLPGWGYKTPIKKFWMCGPSCHPGVGVIGGGRAAVQPVMEDLGIDFEAVVSK